MKPRPKQVVYLWGAGATQAEAQRLGATTSLLMRDVDPFGDGITTRVLKRMASKVRSAFGSDKGVDIEKLISLLAASGIEEHSSWAEEMRRAYFTELKVSLSKAGVLDSPSLAIQVLEMHRDRKFREEAEALSGIITTNHDGLLQVASQHVFGKVNIGFNFFSASFSESLSNAVPPILQLHGSFAWQFGRPIKVGKLHKGAAYNDTVWIPPTILKESKNYPYNKLSGLAYELLARHCDVLRVVGASLTQNDWNILSLIFQAQQHRESTKGTAFLIELIMLPDAGERIKEECAYLKNIVSIPSLSEGNFSLYEDYVNEGIIIPPEDDLANPFAYWLNQKIAHHQSREELSAVGVEEAAA